MPDNFSPAPPPTGGGTTTGGVPTGGGAIPGISNVHNVANQFTAGPQRQLEQQLAQVSQLAKTDPAAAQQQLIQAWSAFLTAGQQFAASNPMGRLVFEQALSTPALIQTVDSLWNETGGGQTGLPSITSIANSGGVGGKVGGLIISSIPLMLDALLKLSRNNQPQPTGTGGTNGGGTTGTTSKPDPTSQSPGKAPEGIAQSWWDKYGGLVLTGATVGANIWGANQAAGAANKAAEIQAAAAREATQLQKNIYIQNRKDLLPRMQIGNNALYRLSDLTGLKPVPRLMPDENVNFLDTANPPTAQPQPAPAPAPNPQPNVDQTAPPEATQQPLSLSQVGQRPPSGLAELAARYRQGRMVS